MANLFRLVMSFIGIAVIIYILALFIKSLIYLAFYQSAFFIFSLIAIIVIVIIYYCVAKL